MWSMLTKEVTLVHECRSLESPNRSVRSTPDAEERNGSFTEVELNYQLSRVSRPQLSRTVESLGVESRGVTMRYDYTRSDYGHYAPARVTH
jgi:hypothetical protein